MSARLLGAVGAAVLASSVLAGCGGDDPGAAPEGGVVTISPSESESESASASASASPSTSASSAPSGPPVLRAVATAQDALPRGTVVAVETATAGWRVDVLRADGRLVRLVVAADGTRLVGAPRPVTDDDADDVAELRSVVERARVDVVEALRVARRTAPGGAIASAELEDEDGQPVWSVDLRQSGGVRVDAVTGTGSPDD